MNRFKNCEVAILSVASIVSIVWQLINVTQSTFNLIWSAVFIVAILFITRGLWKSKLINEDEFVIIPISIGVIYNLLTFLATAPLTAPEYIGIIPTVSGLLALYITIALLAILMKKAIKLNNEWEAACLFGFLLVLIAVGLIPIALYLHPLMVVCKLVGIMGMGIGIFALGFGVVDTYKNKNR